MWEAIIDGRDAGPVWTAIRALADSVVDLGYPAGDLAVFWTYLATVAHDDTEIADRAARANERFLAELERGYLNPALFDGLAGGGWAAAHVGSDAEALLAAIDERLLAQLESWTGHYDLVTGIAGLGVYFLEHDGPTAARGRALVVEQLAARCERDAHGATWRTRPEDLPAYDREAWPEGHYNCGVAHGVAGAIGVLARIAARADAPPLAATLRDDAGRWLAAQRRDGRYPAFVFGDRTAPARTAWCYGEPGIAVALQHPDPGWLAQDVPFADLTLCHGASGLMHLANRMYQATRDTRYRDAARRWLATTLAHGIDQLRPPDDVRRDSLLLGTTGVGLALLAAVSDLEPGWDRLLLCDLPVR